MTKRRNSPRRISGSLSRRDVLRAGGLLLPATVLTPALFTRVSRAASVAFDYYISTNGSDSNPGTLASPWAITAINTKQSSYASKRLGILPGTYDVSVMMKNATYQGAVLQIQGGTIATRTYVGACDASGNYSAGTATLDAKGSVGLYGGGNSVAPYIIGQTNASVATGTGTQATALGNWTMDGLGFTGYANWAVTLSGGVDSPGQIPNVTIQNCTLHDSVSTATTTHPAPLMIYRASNVLVTNCWFYNNKNTAADNVHYAGIQIFDVGGPTTGVVIEKCTLENSSCICVGQDMDPIGVDNVTIRQCYFDMTSAGTNFNQYNALMGFMKTRPGMLADSVHHNIVKGGGLFDVYPTDQGDNAVAVYNNTWDMAGQAGNLGIRLEENVGYGSGQAGGTLFSVYNNLFYDNGSTDNNYGYLCCNIDGFTVCDYNIYGTINRFYAYGVNGGAPTGTVTFTGWKTATGKEAHSTTNSGNPFTNNGARSLQYQISPGSPAYQTGRVGGLTAGAVCNVGAWDGIVTQIGYSSAGLIQPNPPILQSVS